MSTLVFGKKVLRGPRLGGCSPFPAMRELIKGRIGSRLGEYDGLFINYGIKDDVLPYTMQDQYDGAAVDLEFDTAVLENRHLKATFVLDLGARLWSLYDKDAGRELLLDNPEFRPRNLAIRNAWFAGGIEYNIGRRGHDAQTCSPRFAARLQDDDGTPVLRIYEFSRDCAVPFQQDFYLPEESRFLFARMRIMNVRGEVIPMYWWSNIAVAQIPGERIIVPARDTYLNLYDRGSHFITKADLPDGEGFDGTYPDRHPAAKDYFFNIPPESRKYETVIFPDGYGFLFASTSRLIGRKLFVWGQNQGGRRWQRSLVADGVPDYIEIQGGIGKTQQGCIPMPPRTTWEWLEAYGAISAEPSKCFGEWNDAVEHVTEKADAILPDEFLEAELLRTRGAFATRPGEVVHRGSGWGALEEKRLGCKLAGHLDFGTPGAEQRQWCQLLEDRRMDDAMPSSYMVQEEWAALLEKADQNWKTRMHLAIWHYHRKDYERAFDAIGKSLALQENCWNLYALANLQLASGQGDAALATMERLPRLRPDDDSLVKECLKVFIELKGAPERMLAICDTASPALQRKPFLRFCRAYALAYLGDLATAEELLLEGGGLAIPDIREGEISVTDLYIHIQLEKARRAGRTLAAAEVAVPFALDFRMKN